MFQFVIILYVARRGERIFSLLAWHMLGGKVWLVEYLLCYHSTCCLARCGELIFALLSWYRLGSKVW